MVMNQQFTLCYLSFNLFTFTVLCRKGLLIVTASMFPRLLQLKRFLSMLVSLFNFVVVNVDEPFIFL